MGCEHTRTDTRTHTHTYIHAHIHVPRLPMHRLCTDTRLLALAPSFAVRTLPTRRRGTPVGDLTPARALRAHTFLLALSHRAVVRTHNRSRSCNMYWRTCAAAHTHTLMHTYRHVCWFTHTFIWSVYTTRSHFIFKLTVRTSADWVSGSAFRMRLDADWALV